MLSGTWALFITTTVSPASYQAAVVPLWNADILLNGVAASTEFSRVKLTVSQVPHDVTTLADKARWYVPKMTFTSAEAEFLPQFGDNLAAPLLEQCSPSSPVIVVTIAPGTSVGGEAHLWRALSQGLSEDGTHDEVLRASVMLGPAASGRCVLGQRLLRSSISTTSGTGTPVQLGAVAAGKSVYGTMHMIGTTGGTGTTLSVVSSASSGMSATTTRLTFASGTSSRLGEWQEAAGPIADTWWAARWSGFQGTSFTASVSAGIQ